jgi:hypothetical protein
MSQDVYEVINTVELAKRWNLPESWIRDQVRTRAADPIPCLRFGRYVKFEWPHPELLAWLARKRRGYSNCEIHPPRTAFSERKVT